MKSDEEMAREIGRLISDLNVLFRDAASGGLKVEIDTLHLTAMGDPECTLVITPKVRRNIPT